MNDSRSIQLSQFQYWLSNNRLLLITGILLAHCCLLGMLCLLPSNALRELHNAEPLPMVMVDLRPPVPLAMGAHSHSSKQAVTSHQAMAMLSHEAAEEASPDIPTRQQSALPKSPSLPEATKSANRTPSGQPESSMSTPKQIANTPTTSEHAMTAPQAATTYGVSSHNDAPIKSGATIASTSTTSSTPNTGASAPQYGAGYLSNPAPEYPELAREMGEEGKVLLRVLVTPEGQAKKVKLYRPSGSDSLDDAAIKAVRKWRFVPAKLGEQAVEAWVFVPIVFKLD